MTEPVADVPEAGEATGVREDVQRAGRLLEAARPGFAAEGLELFACLDPYEHGCMVHVDFFDDERQADGDGLTFTVATASRDIEVLDPHDYHLSEPELLEYLVMRARGAQPRQAIAVIEAARPKRIRWWNRAVPLRSGPPR